MFQSKTIMSIFPTNLWAHDVAPQVSGPLNEKLKARIDELLTPRPVIGPGESWHITPGTVHRFRAVTDVTLFEVSTPELEDVVRLEDDYGREGTSAD